MTENKKFEAPVVEKKTFKPAVESEKGDLLKRIGDFLREFDSLESNIPHNHEYWDLLNRYRAL